MIKKQTHEHKFLYGIHIKKSSFFIKKYLDIIIIKEENFYYVN